MFKKATKLLSTMVIVAGTVVGNFSPTLALAEGVVKAGDTEGMTNTVKVKDDSLADCKRILEGQAAFPVQAGETEPVDLVVVEDASGSFSDNFPHVRQAIDEVVQGLSDQDRVMLASYRGGKQFIFPDGKVKINSADYDMNVRVDTQLTHDKSQFVSGFGDVRTYGGTPTASGLKLALDTYNQTHGDLTNRKTYFLLVTDGVANTRLDGYLHKTNTNDSINEYPDPRHPFQVSVEYSNDYQGAAAEVLALNQEITNQGYEMINAYWESVESLSSVNSYFDKYKTEVGPFVKQELQQGSSTPEDFITSQSIDDFTTQLKQIVKDRLAQSTPATASLTIADQFDIQSATATDDAGNDVPVQINGQTISATSTEGYVGNITIHYEVKENTAIDAATLVSSGTMNQGTIAKEFPEATIPKNDNAHACDVTPEDPTITKDIENQEHLDLTNREDSFDWHVKTAFGNETSTWQQASLVDNVNQLLDIQKVVVTDENGKDVTANGTVTQANNKVTFEMNKQADSYDYLSGHTYTMTITTTIKASATDEELAPYIEQGGIPNQADLNFGNEGDVLHSNKPTVTPPPVDPNITKDVEGQEHLDLTNRDQEFKWNVKTAFGNETSTWTQASMVDDINKVLDITDVKVTDENGKDVTANGTVTQENNKVTFEMNKQADSYSYLAGHTYTMTITTKIKDGATDEELAPYIEQGGIPNQADLNFGNEGDVLHSNKPTVTPPAPTPEDPTITKDIEGQEHLDLTNRDQEFKWNVKTAFGNETSTWTQASMVDDINKVLDITDVKVTDENGKDVTANGTVTQENNKVTFEMNKQADSYDYLSGHTYTMTITTKIKADATDEELAPYIEQGGIPNQADLNFGNEGDVLHSNKPTVTPPAPTPEDPTITKDIEGQDHLDLTNRDQEFKWNVKTAFGNETSTWTQASMVDDINKVLDITDVKVTDENGKDVTANGTVTQENNKVTFEMNKKDDSYSYLAGHTYTMTITTKIKDGATDEELAPYIEQGGIPNQADLNFGNEGDVLHSNKPTVTPPAPTPEDPTITKDIEGQEHLDLTNRDQEFKWNVKTAFGNETSTWTQASMVDDINQLLDITDVKVTDENGKDVTANGKVTQENNKVTFEMNKKDDSYSYLAGHTYTMTITTKIKADATDEELAPYIEQGGIPNQADLNFGNEGDVLHSNKPTVTPPAPTPEDPTITKDIEGQEHLDLTNRDQEFKWNVKTAFGNETSTWTQASMVDDINQLLDITDVKVTDENGKDVTANGKVTQENNKVTFEMNKKDDSYSYLAGHTYTMTITTKIKADATDEELAPYIEQGGIPNQADLNFGNEGDVLHSNKPTVTPPAPTPEDPKKPEPKQPLKPKKPLTPTNHQAPTNPVNFGKSASKGIHLPMTNTTVNPLYMIAGLIVLIVAISFGITKNKKRKN
ncbi:isopeptide-forming domain-containing fimbrial protein [Enterococcus faecalis]|nr:isopeptide-forming domain-containing fimbrial protein [Enterococcus faecalis]